MAIEEDPEGHEIHAIRDLIPSFALRRVLEIGAGDGRLTERYAHEAESVIAIDPDAEAVAALAAALPGVDARAIAFENLTLPAGSVDVVVFAWSL